MRKLICVFTNLFFLFSLNVVAQTTIIIQPHFGQGRQSLIGFEDSTNPICFGNTYQYVADSSNYHAPEFNAIAWTNAGCPISFRDMVRFNALSDTTLIPHSATILSARLVLYGIPSSPYGNYGNSYYPGSPYPSTNLTWLYELADSFNAYTATWNSQPSIMHIDSIGIPPSYSHWNETDTMDVTTMVTDMVANVNTGFLLRLQSEAYYRERMYAGCYYADSTLHPKLIVTISCINSITGEPTSDTVNAGDTAIFEVTTSLISPTFQWQEDPGTGFVDLANVWPYSGVNTKILTIQDASMFLNFTHYRCLVSNGSSCTDTSSSAILVIHPSTGIETITAEAINIFPNPAHDNIMIQLPRGNNNGNVELLDELGRLLSVKKIAGSTVNFDLGELPLGMYVLKISDNGQAIYKKVIKN